MKKIITFSAFMALLNIAYCCVMIKLNSLPDLVSNSMDPQNQYTQLLEIAKNISYVYNALTFAFGLVLFFVLSKRKKLKIRYIVQYYSVAICMPLITVMAFYLLMQFKAIEWFSMPFIYANGSVLLLITISALVNASMDKIAESKFREI